MNEKILKSKLDASVNFITEIGKGYHEARYVRREDEYFIVYLSSHNGCNKSCRFCHLTATGQTMFDHTTPSEYRSQAVSVLQHYDSLNKPANRVNFNFMARGEALANNFILNNFDEVHEQLAPLAENRNLQFKYNISTILPKDLPKPLTEIFDKDHPAYIYYSLYSLNEKFRKRWLPKAHDVKDALSILKEYQDYSNKEIVFHWAFIKNENDSEKDVHEIGQALSDAGLYGRFNIVRYNPYSESQGQEADEEIIERNLQILNSYIPHEKSRIIPKVGFDIAASCGTFIQSSKPDQIYYIEK